MAAFVTRVAQMVHGGLVAGYGFFYGVGYFYVGGFGGGGDSA